MFCAQCGNAIIDQNGSCTKCGERVPSTPLPASTILGLLRKAGLVLSLFLIVLAISGIKNILTDTHYEGVDGHYCHQVYGGQWECYSDVSSIMIDPVSYARYSMPFAITWLCLLGAMFYAIYIRSWKILIPMIAGIVLFGFVQKNYHPNLHIQGLAAGSPQQLPASTPADQTIRDTAQDMLNQSVPPIGQDGKSLPDNSGEAQFTAKGPDGGYAFVWCRALHELTETPAYSLRKLDPNADPDAELPTMHLETYLLRRPQSEQKGVFIFGFGEYEALKQEQKAAVQGFCKERIRILHKAWPDVDEQYWRQGGWYELDAPGSAGKLKPVCN